MPFGCQRKSRRKGQFSPQRIKPVPHSAHRNLCGRRHRRAGLETSEQDKVTGLVHRPGENRCSRVVCCLFREESRSTQADYTILVRWRSGRLSASLARRQFWPGDRGPTRIASSSPYSKLSSARVLTATSSQQVLILARSPQPSHGPSSAPPAVGLRRRIAGRPSRRREPSKL